MTGWIIAGAIIVFLLVLLMTSVKVRFEYTDELRLKINWLFITLVRIPARTKKMKRRDKEAKKDAEKAAKETSAAEESSAGDTSDKEESGSSDGTAGEKSGAAPAAEKKPEKKRGKKSGSKLTLKDIFELVKLVWDSLGKPLKRLLKATRISGFRLRIKVGGDDAAQAAIRFGAVNMAAGNALAFLDGCFTLKKPDFRIDCDFMSEETTYECYFTARLTPIAALAFLFWLLGRFVKNYLSRKDAAAALNKLRKR